MNAGVCVCEKQVTARWNHLNSVKPSPSSFKRQQSHIQAVPPEGVEWAIKPRSSLWKRAAGSEVCCWIVAFVSLSQGGFCQPGSDTVRGLCLTWSLAHLCSFHMYGAMLMLQRHACMQRAGQPQGGWQWALIGAGWVGSCGCGLDFRCEEIVVPCCRLAYGFFVFIQKNPHAQLVNCFCKYFRLMSKRLFFPH